MSKKNTTGSITTPTFIIVNWEGRSYEFSVDREEILRPAFEGRPVCFCGGWDVEGVFSDAPVRSIDTEIHLVETRHGQAHHLTTTLREYFTGEGCSMDYLEDVSQAISAEDGWHEFGEGVHLDAALAEMDLWHGDEFRPNPYTSD